MRQSLIALSAPSGGGSHARQTLSRRYVLREASRVFARHSIRNETTPDDDGDARRVAITMRFYQRAGAAARCLNHFSTISDALTSPRPRRGSDRPALRVLGGEMVRTGEPPAHTILCYLLWRNDRENR